MAEVKYLSVKQVADELGISRIAVWKKIQSGAIKAFRFGRNYSILSNYKILKTKRKPLPTMLELDVQELLDSMFPGMFKYVGKRSFCVERFNPDFIRMDSKKQIIECFGTYWHRDSQERDKLRINTYRQYGYETLVIWEHELKDKSKLIDKIVNFSGSLQTFIEPCSVNNG